MQGTDRRRIARVVVVGAAGLAWTGVVSGGVAAGSGDNGLGETQQSWQNIFTHTADTMGISLKTIAIRLDAPGATFALPISEFTDSTTGVHLTWVNLPLFPEFADTNIVATGEPETGALTQVVHFSGQQSDWSPLSPLIFDAA